MSTERDRGGSYTFSGHGASCNIVPIGASTFKYLFAKYKIAESSWTFPVQKSSTSRESVIAQSYNTTTGHHK